MAVSDIVSFGPGLRGHIYLTTRFRAGAAHAHHNGAFRGVIGWNVEGVLKLARFRWLARNCEQAAFRWIQGVQNRLKSWWA